MRRIKIGAGVLNQTPLDWDGNFGRIVQAIEAARRAGIQVLCLPELCIPGYGCEDAFYAPNTQSLCLDVLREIVPETSGIVVSVGLALFHQGSVYNVAALISDGNLQGFVAKQNLAGDGLHYEPRWFKPWPKDLRADVVVFDQPVPLGDLVFNCGGIRFGFEICEDAWVADRPGEHLARRGVDILLNPSASHFAFGKHEVRKRFVQDGSRAFSVGYVYANLLGNEAGRAIYDGDAMIASCGELLVRGPRFSFADVKLTQAHIDVDEVRLARSRVSSFRAELASASQLEVTSPFSWNFCTATDASQVPITWEESSNHKEEEFTRAIALGLFDYLRKSRSAGFVISLSGGADSAAVAVLVALAFRFAEDELGPQRSREKLDHIRCLDHVEKLGDAAARLITCAYQATRNSGNVTREAAQAVASAINADFHEFDVDSLVQDYIQLASQAMGRELNWSDDDIALQNIQARVRAPSIWLMANLRNSLLLATSNRSEAAVGYATMDGDTCGGLSPIAGIDKAFLRNWLRWMETEGPAGFAPIAALGKVNAQHPTAELRPQAAGQTDEQDLMPYEILDAMEASAVRDMRAPLEVFHDIRERFPEWSSQQIGTWVEKFFQLWSRNQWKRERYAVSFHVDDRNLDPRSWCRFPVLSGGYRRELQALRDFLDSPS